MGFEYKISFRVPDPAELEMFLARLRISVPTNEDRPDYTASLESDGFYFCDHTKSERSSAAFRRLVDVGLKYSEVVIHEL